MNAPTVLNIVGLTTAALIFIAGIGILTGFLLSNYIQEQLRLILGIMFVVYGVFRGGMIYSRTRRQSREEKSRE